MKNTLKAGVSIVDITPPIGVELAGYPHCPRNNTGVHDPLYASCIYLEDGNTKLALVATDLLIYSKKYVNIVRQRVSEKTSIPMGNIMICCVHSHSAPWTSGRLDLEALEHSFGPDENYIEEVNNKLINLIIDAYSNTFSAKIGVEKGYCGKEQGVGGNRRDPNGPSDPDVWVLGVQDIMGNWRGALIEYALHPTVLQSESTVVSADYPGYTREYLFKKIPGLVLLFSQGTSGNQSTRYFRSSQTFDEACRIGSEIGTEVEKVLNHMVLSSDIGLVVKKAEVEVELRVLPEKVLAQNNVETAKNELKKLHATNASYIDIRNAELKLLGAEDILGYVKLKESSGKLSLLEDEMPAEIMVIGIGEARIVCFQGELFVEYSLKIKDNSQFPKTFVIELANGGLPGYVYTIDSLKDGGYETDTSMLDPNTGDIFVEKALKLIEETK